MSGPAEARVVVFKTPWCGFCRMAEHLLVARGIPFEARLVDDPAARSALVERTGWRTVPVILIDGELIGGYSELAALDRRGGLAELLH